MYEATQDATWAHGIELAQEAEFDLGSLRVRPARCELEWNGVSQLLQRRVMQVLVTLAQARGAVVSQNDLVIRCWRGLSVSDDAIYRCISQLRKIAAGYPVAPFAIEAIPGVGYRLTSTENAASATLEAAPPRRDRSRFLALVAGAALLMLVIAGATFWILRGRVPAHEALSVAVQPFEALGDSSNARSLARRLPNEIVDVLGDSQIDTLLAGEQAKDAVITRPAPGLIVTGIVRDDAQNTIVDLRIEDGRTRAALWSTEFKRENEESSDLPLEVAARVADAVNTIDFARNANPPLTDDSALTAVIQSNDILRGANDEAWASLLQKTEDVVARHPEFAFGHSNLAAAYAWASGTIDDPNRSRAMRDAARRQANLALKLDPEDAGAYAVLSGLVAPYDHRGREAILLRGIKFARHPKQPLAGLYSYEGLQLGAVGRLREAVSYQLVARAKDEWGPARTTKLAGSYANMGDFAAARNTLQKAIEYWPNHPGVRKWQQYIVGFYEQPSDALEVFKDLDERPSFRESNAIWRAFVEAKAARSGQVTNAAILTIRIAGDQGTISRENEIMMIAALGESKQAIEIANNVLDHQSLEPSAFVTPATGKPSLEPWFLFTPVTRSLRQDPGFVPLAARMGLIKYWRETGKKPDFCADPGRGECSPQLLAALK